MSTVGVDVSKKTLDLGITISGRSHNLKVDNHKRAFPQILKWARKIGKNDYPAFCLENTGRYGDQLADWLYGQNCVVYVVNPSRIRSYAKSINLRGKTDEIDALLIGRFAEQNDLKPYVPRTDDELTLHSFNQYRQNLVNQQSRISNQIESLLDEPCYQPVFRLLKADLSHVEERIQQVETEIFALIAQNEAFLHVIRLLLTIPGIGPVTAPILLERLVRGFGSAREICQHAGLVPVPYRSGTSVRRGDHISRLSDAALRRALYMPACSVTRTNGPFAAFYNALVARGKAPMVALVAVMRKLLSVAYGVYSHNTTYDPLLVLARA